MKVKRKPTRGFALVVIVLLVGVLSVSAASMLDLVGVDRVIGNRQADAQRALSVAETGMFEVLSSRAFDREKPADLTNRAVSFDPAGSGTSLLAESVSEESQDGTYDVEVRFVGVGEEVTDSSNRRFVPFKYDVTVNGETGGGLAQATIRTRVIYKVASRTGLIVPETWER
ncbi:MAG: hypothetical protein HC923_03420 [Myxococcales bacterium]|nr:hypothetical protein [Myxococcales bacterium]